MWAYQYLTDLRVGLPDLQVLLRELREGLADLWVDIRTPTEPPGGPLDPSRTSGLASRTSA